MTSKRGAVAGLVGAGALTLWAPAAMACANGQGNASSHARSSQTTSGAPASGHSTGNGAPARGQSTSSTEASGGTSFPAQSGSQAPAGNNGHIQIDTYNADGGPSNDSHVGCGLSVNFYGYDAGNQSASITVAPWSPTPGGSPATFTTGWTTTQRTSGNQLDQTYQVGPADVAAIFKGVTPAKQGYHARVEVEVSGSRGSDDKYHMVWLQGCSQAAAGSIPGASAPSSAQSGATGASPGVPTATPSAVEGASLGGTPGSSASTPEVAGAEQASPTSPTPTGAAGPGTAVLGESLTRPSVTSAAGLGAAPVSTSPVVSGTSIGGLPFTGADIAGETAAATGLLGLGTLMVRRNRRRRH
jgi:hypothetical protein